MKKETKIVKVTCDVCGELCVQDNRELFAKYWTDHTIFNKIKVKVFFYGSYETDGDVCNKCAIEALEEVLHKLKDK